MANPPPTAARPVLVVEDDPHVAYLVQFFLERENYPVRLVRDGREAAVLIGGDPPGLAVLDVMLPHVDGYLLLKQIRASARWASVPVLMLTAKSQESEIVRALDAGANDYVVKPFQPEEFMARVRRLIPDCRR